MYQPINTLQKGCKISQIFLIADSEKRFTKTKKPYAVLTLRDVTGSMTARIWGWDLDKNDPGQWIRIDGEVVEFNGVLHISAEDKNAHPCPNPPENIDDYIKGIPEQVVEQLYGELLTYIDKVENRFMRAMLDFEFRQNTTHIEKYKTIPSSHNVRGAYKGGFLVHLVAVLKIANYLCDLYGERGIYFSKDIVITSVLLHDVGKLYAFEQDGEVWKQTDEQRLLNHLPMSLYIVQQLFIVIESALQEEVPKDIKNAISHCVLTHHGEHGPMAPRTLEASIVHLADLSDSQITLFLEAKETQRTDQDWIDYHRIIGAPVWTKDIE